MVQPTVPMTLEQAQHTRSVLARLTEDMDEEGDTAYRWTVLEPAMSLLKGQLCLVYGTDWLHKMNRALCQDPDGTYHDRVGQDRGEGRAAKTRRAE